MSRDGICGCLTKYGSDHNVDVPSSCQQAGTYDGLCWYHLKMALGRIEPFMSSRTRTKIIVTKPGFGRIYPLKYARTKDFSNELS